MYSTGQIGLWSVIEEGIGLTAGSMPALGPLLHTRVFGRSRSDRSDGPVKPTASMWRRNMAQRKRTAEDSIALDTYVGGVLTTIRDRDGGHNDNNVKDLETIREEHHHHHHHRGRRESERMSPSQRTSDDGDSQKHILKETRVTITHEVCPGREDVEEYRKEQILGWRSQ